MIQDVRGGRVRDIEEAEKTVAQLRDLIVSHQSQEDIMTNCENSIADSSDKSQRKPKPIMQAVPNLKLIKPQHENDYKTSYKGDYIEIEDQVAQRMIEKKIKKRL